MIGVIIVTHGQLGLELLKTAELIVGGQSKCSTVSIEISLNPDFLRQLVETAIKAQDEGQGVLILTDMFGGTPSNISLSFLEEERVEVLTGANLPMLLRVLQLRVKPERTLSELALDSRDYSRKAINMAGDMLKRRPSK
ncbi:MAG: PTS sugar transporter subunit IIA [Deltaproteobacteria bacterium]|nr:PTS sugar transporter subunit IIA [Deltaproteobacteria bacterium]